MRNGKKNINLMAAVKLDRGLLPAMLMQGSCYYPYLVDSAKASAIWSDIGVCGCRGSINNLQQWNIKRSGPERSSCQHGCSWIHWDLCCSVVRDVLESYPKWSRTERYHSMVVRMWSTEERFRQSDACMPRSSQCISNSFRVKNPSNITESISSLRYLYI
jgi:hypothetical protein